MYNSLDILPVKTYFKIIETGNLFLLSFSDKKVAELELSELWNEINQAFQERDNNQANKRIFRISTDIEYLISKYNLIQMCVNTLRFDRNQEVIDIPHRRDDVQLIILAIIWLRINFMKGI